MGGVHECAGGVGLIGNAGGQHRGGSPACWSCVRSSPLNDPAAPARRRRHESARWMMPTKTYGNPRWHWAEGAPHCGRPCAQGRLRSPPGAGLTFTTRHRTALAQQVGRACPPAQSGARAQYERHAIAVLSQGSTWGSGGWGSSPRRPRQRGGLRTRCRAGQGPSSIRRSRSHTRRHAPWRWRAVRVGRGCRRHGTRRHGGEGGDYAWACAWACA